MPSFGSVELIGYLASALVVISLAMTSVVRLRVISLAGSVVFVAYGLLIGSIPVVITNACIAMLNLWFLRKEFSRSGRDLGAVPIAVDAPFLLDFLHSHDADIRQFQPDFAGVTPDSCAWLLTRDGLPAGALVGRREGDELVVVLDYVLKPYRDSRLGRWLYGPGARVFRDIGLTRLVAPADTASHISYLRSVGFRPESSGMVLDLEG